MAKRVIRGYGEAVRVGGVGFIVGGGFPYSERHRKATEAAAAGLQRSFPRYSVRLGYNTGGGGAIQLFRSKAAASANRGSVAGMTTGQDSSGKRAVFYAPWFKVRAGLSLARFAGRHNYELTQRYRTVSILGIVPGRCVTYSRARAIDWLKEHRRYF